MKHLQTGAILEGRYRIEKLLARGGQAHVYRGRHLVLERTVAIKLLRPGMEADVSERMTRRFAQEARLISALRDPHTITLYDFGRLEDGGLFMVFEYIDGESLKELLKTGPELAPHRVAKILRQTLSSLQEAHALGVLHRDIKPANIMLYEHAGRTDQVKLLDFGIAKILQDSDEFVSEALTGVNNLVGTPRYIAPEAYQQGVELCPASDLYSLGLVAYELLTGHPAIKGSTPIDVFRNHLATQNIRLPEDVRAPAGLRELIERMLRRELADRYESAEQVLWDLRSWQREADATLQQTFDPSDLAIPDPYEDVAPTQTLSSDAINEALAKDPNRMRPPQADPAPSAGITTPTNPATDHHTPPPGSYSTSDAISREALLAADAPTRLDAPSDEHPAPLQQSPARAEPDAGVETEILTNVPNIDDLLLGQLEEDSEPSELFEESRSDDTANVNLEEALREDARLAAAASEIQWDAPSTRGDEDPEGIREPPPPSQERPHPRELREDDDEPLDPDDQTMRLEKLPPLKQAAVLRRRPRRRAKDEDDSSSSG